MSKYAIETYGLEKTYGTKIKSHVLKGIDLLVPKGTFCCIVGPSGHGKTTLLQMIGGLDLPTKGRVVLDGEELSLLNDNKLSDIRAKKIGFVFQFFNLLDHLTAAENVQMAMMFTKKNSADANERALELLDIVGLKDKANHKISELSGGQLQRISIARALANEPELLLMDEPTGNLDSQSEKEVLDCIFKIHASGKTIIMVTHSAEISKRAEMTVEIYDGLVRK